MQLLNDFEQAVYRKKFDRATVLMHKMLSNFEDAYVEDSSSNRPRIFFRLACSISELFLNSRYVLAFEAYQLLCGSHSKLAAVFAGTEYENADHIISQLADIRDLSNIRFQNEQILMKCLLCYSPNSRYAFSLEELAEKIPQLAAPLIVGHLSSDLLIYRRAHQKYNETLSKGWDFLDKADPSLPILLSLSTAWMGCSYANTATKHNIKIHLNRMACNWLEKQNVKRNPECASFKPGDRPRLLLVLEIFNIKHAMFRCFSKAVRKLHDLFEVTAVVPENCIDAESEALFKNVIKFEPQKVVGNFFGFVGSLREHKADIVYYPSLGMANYAILLANTRLAPVQCMGLGHPASSFIDTMDYVVVQEQDFVDESVYGETVVLTGNDTSATIETVLALVDSPNIETDPDVIRIAITSKHMKINHDFLECCALISQQSVKPVEFYVFPGVKGCLLDAVAHGIKKTIPNSVVYPTTDYASYLSNLSRCHLRLGTFPFGGANTNMDCFGLAIPFVVMAGNQPHAQSDVAQMRQAGMPDWLIANNREEYVKSGLRLVNNNGERVALSHYMLSLKDKPFFNGRTEDTLRLDTTLAWLCKHHKSIASAKKRVWSLADQEQLEQVDR